MRVTDLIQKTTNEIPCPYDSMKFSIGGVRTIESAAQGNQYFYDFNAPGDHQHRKRGGKFNQDGGHHQKRPRQPNFDQGTQNKLIFNLLFFCVCEILINFFSIEF